MIPAGGVRNHRTEAVASRGSTLNPDAPEFQSQGGAHDTTNFQHGSKVATMTTGHNGPTLCGTVEGVAIQFLADTGAESTILSRRSFESLPRAVRMKFQDNTGSVYSADGRRVPSKGPVVCELEIAGHRILDTIFVADIEDSALLGWEAQLALGVEYRVAGVDLASQRHTTRVCTPPVRRIRATEDFIVPGRSEVIVRGQIEGRTAGEAVLVSPVDDCPEYKVAVAHIVVDGATTACPVRLLNPTEDPQHFRRGEVIAKAEEVNELRAEEPGPTVAATSLPEHLREMYDRAIQAGELGHEVARKLEQLLIDHASVFATSEADLGRTNLVQHDIDTGDAIPIRQPPRRIPLAQQGEYDQEIESMREKGVIEPGQSPWASPVVLVRKKDGSLRFCVDYRRLNSVTRFDAYPLPRIDETLDALGGARWFTTLDLLSGYWQVGLTPEAKLKSAFCTRSGLYLFNVMPFGLCNAPSTFERLMETVLQGLQWRTCLVYLDDVVVFGSDEEQLLQRMDEVFTRLHRAGLKIKPNKCHLFCRDVEYLGHVIGENGVRVSPDKVAAVKEWPVPTCVTDVRSFLGTASYYRRFIPGFATIASPLHEMTNKDKRFEWTAECQYAFDHLKGMLCQAPVLAFPVPGAKFILDTDASDKGIGAVLSQLVPIEEDEQEEQHYEEKVLGYASRTLSLHEKRYCTTRKELLAVVWFLRHYRPYLYGQEFIVRTDHSSLQWLCNFWEPEGQIARWLQIIGEYSFKVIHREGKKHGNADGLSRQGSCTQCGMMAEVEEQSGPQGACPERINLIPTTRRTVTHIDTITLVPEWTPNQLAVWQEADVDISPIQLSLKAGRKLEELESTGWSAASKRYLAEFERMKLVEGVVYRVWYDDRGQEERYQLLAPKPIRAQVLQVAHDGEVAGHFAEKKTAAKVRQYFYWAGLLTDVRKYCETCEVCQRRKPAPNRPHHPLQQEAVGEPLQRVTLDILGFDRATERGNRYILVIVDTLTKWAEAISMKDEKAETVARFLVEEFVCRVGIPAQLHSDQGRQFEAVVFQEMCRLLGIRKTRTTPLHPQSDGQTERLNRTLLDLLAKLSAEHPADWDTKLPYAMAAYRSTPHTTTGETPNRLMLGRESTTPLTLLALPIPDAGRKTPWVERLENNFQETHRLVQDHYGKAQRTQKAVYDRRVKEYNFSTRDKVWLFDPRPKRGGPYKLNPGRWDGPYEVRKRISAAVYLIGLPGSNRTKVVSTQRLRPYIQRDERLEPHLPPPEQTSEPDVQDETVVQQSADVPADEVADETTAALPTGDIGFLGTTSAPQATHRPQRPSRRPGRLKDFSLEQDEGWN